MAGERGRLVVKPIFEIIDEGLRSDATEAFDGGKLIVVHNVRHKELLFTHLKQGAKGSGGSWNQHLI